MSPDMDRLPAGTSVPAHVTRFLQCRRSWFKPSWIAERLHLKYGSVKKVW
ncbi:MAG: hypothetical protein ACFFBD_24495 [Candidatus Hodarchaeota archaeon]